MNEIFSLFPTPVAILPDFISEEERLELLKMIEDIPRYKHGSIDGDGYSTYDMGFYDEVATNFVNDTIKERVQEVVDGFTEMTGDVDASLADFWFNVQNSGSKLCEHTHAQSIISGALYINVDETCKLYFHNPNPYTHFVASKTSTSFNYQNQWIPVKNCQMVLFPSWLKHGNNREVNTMDNRIVISFNTLPIRQ
tara:strand:- start:225 stop:809 length:585 start_codon:yes stop_codon:yes gene_type:complete